MKNPGEAVLVDVFVERRNGSAVTPVEGRLGNDRLALCLDLHGILLERSYLAPDGKRMLCHFRAPDAESLRIALRVAGIEYDALWAGAETEDMT